MLLISISNFSFASSKSNCVLPKGEFTSLEMVLNQFVLNNGNPNWGDWCYEGKVENSKPCNDELEAWDEWLICSGLVKEVVSL